MALKRRFNEEHGALFIMILMGITFTSVIGYGVWIDVRPILFP